MHSSSRPEDGSKRSKTPIVVAALIVLALLSGTAWAVWPQEDTPSMPPGASQDPQSPPQAEVPPETEILVPETVEPEVPATETAPSAPQDAVPSISGYVSEPWNVPGADFGYLVGVPQVSDGGVQVLRFDRAQYSVDTDGHPLPVVNENTTIRTFDLTPDATFFGSTSVAPDVDLPGREMSSAEFFEGVGYYLRMVGDETEGIPVWLFHATADLDSPVRSVQENFIP